jgi:DNA polymerase-3 subunit delta'
MAWSTVIGQSRIKDLLKHSIASKQLAHAYLFYGIRGIGKQAMAIEFARTLLCARQQSDPCDDCTNCRKVGSLQHPDVRIVFPLPAGKNEKTGEDPLATLDAEQIDLVREQINLKAQNPYHQIQIPKANFIKINSVRDIKRISSMSSVQGDRKIFLIFDADQMNPEASNSLLKTLEEPTENTLLILTSSEKDRLLPTIISRCQMIQFSPLRDAEVSSALEMKDGVAHDEALVVAKIAQGSYTVAKELLPTSVLAEREEVLAFLRASLGWKEVSLVEMIDGLASSHDRPAIEQWLKLLQSWFRDAMILRNGTPQSEWKTSTNQSLVSFVEKFPRANLEGAVQCVDNYIALVRKNVYLHLVLTSLSFDLRKTLTQGS